MKYASPGTVSHGTLRLADLIPTFRDALEALSEQNLYTSDGDERRLVTLQEDITECLARIERAQTEPDYLKSETAEWHLNDLIDLLSAFAPPGHYFGSHVGDGSDFGFWPCDEEV